MSPITAQLARPCSRLLGRAGALLALVACGQCGSTPEGPSSLPTSPATSPAAPEAPRPVVLTAPAAPSSVPSLWQPEEELAWPPPLDSIAFRPDGAALAVGAGPGLWVVPLGAGRELATQTPRRLDESTWVASVRWTADGSGVRVTDRYYGDGHGAQVVDASSGQVDDLAWPITGGWPWHAAYSRDLSVFVISERMNVSVWTEAAGQVAATETHGTDVQRLAATNTSAASTDGRELWLWSLPSMAEGAASPPTRRAVLPWVAKETTQLRFSVDGSVLAAASDTGSVLLVDVPGGALRATLVHAGRVSDVAFSADGRRLATACADGAARIWSIENAAPEALRTIGYAVPVQTVDLSADGGLLVTGGDDGRVRLYDTATGEERGAIALIPPTDP